MKKAALIALIALTISITSPAFAATPVAGKWMTTEKDSIVEIGQCGTDICGKVIRILKSNPKGANVDSNNPNPAMRNRPILGLTILSGFKNNGDNWIGNIYDPRRGKIFKSYLKKQADGNLQVKGCISFLCQSFIWTPAS